MEEKEILFAKTLEQAKETARSQQNRISEEQLEELFAPLQFTKEQLAMVHDYLRGQKISIGESADDGDNLTEAEKNYLQIYLRQIRAVPRLDAGKKEALILSAMAGEQDAQSRLIEQFLEDVVGIARIYAGQGVLLEDLIGEGNVALAMGVGMLGCLESAAEAQGMLARMIMDAMEEHIAETAAHEKTGRKAAEKVNKIADRANQLAAELRRKVTPLELAGETGLSLMEIMDAVRISGYRIESIEVDRNV